MSHLLANLYQLRPIDESFARWRWVNYYQDVTNAGNPITSADFFPPDDKVWFLTNVYGLAKGVAATTTAESVRFDIITGGSIVGMIAGTRVNPALAAGASLVYHAKVDVLLVGGSTGLRARFGFDAGNAGNQVQWSYGAYEVPKGNVLV